MREDVGSDRQDVSFGSREGKSVVWYSTFRRHLYCGNSVVISSMPAEYCVGRRSYLLVDDVGHIQPTEERSIQEPAWMDIGRPLHCRLSRIASIPVHPSIQCSSHVSVSRGEAEILKSPQPEPASIVNGDANQINCSWQKLRGHLGGHHILPV